MVKDMKSMREQFEYLKLENKSLREEKQLREQNLCADSESNEISCAECGLVCSSRNHLRSHMKHHMDIKYRCRVCNNEYSTNEELETHKEENHGTKHVNDVEYLRCMDCSFQDPDKNFS